MEQIWKYTIELDNSNVFEEIEMQRRIKLPDEFKDFIREHNASTPSMYRFMAGSDERILGSILCFNRNEPDCDLVFDALDSINDNNLFPFGIDPFGNYICLSLCNDLVVFLDHETQIVISTNKIFKDFISSLY